MDGDNASLWPVFLQTTQGASQGANASWQGQKVADNGGVLELVRAYSQ